MPRAFPDGEIRRRCVMRRAAVVDEDKVARPRQLLSEALDSPRIGEWSSLLNDRDGVLVVGRVGRSVNDVIAALWLIDAGVPLVLLDSLNASPVQRDSDLLGATHLLNAGVLGRCGARRAQPVHQERRIVMPTAGSTGQPKYVSLSAGNVIENAGAVAEELELRHDDVGVTTLSPAHSYGLSNVLAHVSADGTVLCTDEPITSERFWMVIRQMGVTSLAFAASSARVVLAALQKSMAPGTLRRIMFAGGRVDPALVPRLCQEGAQGRFGVHFMYGQTEAGPRISISRADGEPTSWGCVGPGLDGVRTRVVDPQGDEQRAGREGRIQVASPYTMAGYIYGAGDLTQQPQRLDWLDTGDRGRRDTRGRLWVDGRADDQIKVSGYRIDLAVLRDEAEQIFGCAVAVAAGTYAVTVYIETSAELSSADHDVTTLAERAGLPAGLILVATVDELPRGASGKVDLERLKAVIGTTLTDSGDDR